MLSRADMKQNSYSSKLDGIMMIYFYDMYIYNLRKCLLPYLLGLAIGHILKRSINFKHLWAYVDKDLWSLWYYDNKNNFIIKLRDAILCFKVANLILIYLVNLCCF